MRDLYSRSIDYLRISITDRCNLRCKYCLPEDIELIKHDDILTYDEITRLVRIFTGIGIKNIKITGGEPLVRLNAIGLIDEIKKIQGIENVTMTTNAVLIDKYLDDMVKVGINGINISLDTLDAAVYESITGKDVLRDVLSGINSAVNAGIKTKVNCVPMKGVNDHELADIAALAKDLPLDIRFIELMPTSQNEEFSHIPSEDVLEKLKKTWPDLRPTDEKRGFGPARYYTSDELKGKIGFISALSNHFCENCNRLRLTSEGYLKLCIHHDDGIDLRELLRTGKTDEEIKKKIEETVVKKPESHSFLDKDEDKIKSMSKIGG